MGEIQSTRLLATGSFGMFWSKYIWYDRISAFVITFTSVISSRALQQQVTR